MAPPGFRDKSAGSHPDVEQKMGGFEEERAQDKFKPELSWTGAG